MLNVKIFKSFDGNALTRTGLLGLRQGIAPDAIALNLRLRVEKTNFQFNKISEKKKVKMIKNHYKRDPG